MVSPHRAYHAGSNNHRLRPIRGVRPGRSWVGSALDSLPFRSVSARRFPLSVEVRRNQQLSKWLVRSDYLCNKYLTQLSRGIRDSRLSTDVVGTVLSGLATILAPVGTKTALSGAATIVLGVGGDFQSDLFAQQAGEVLISAVQTVRNRARKDLQDKMQAPYETYTLEQGLVDVQRYDQETCNLNVGLNELRASLIVGPDVKRPNNPILPLPPGPPSSLLPPPPPIMPPVPPPPGPPPSAGPGTRKSVARTALDPSATLTAAINRITTQVTEPTAQANVLEKCGLPKETISATALTESSKMTIAKCLNQHVITPVPTPVSAQVLLDSALIKLRPLPIEEKKRATQKCLEVAKFPPTTLPSDLLSAKLTKSQEEQVKTFAECLSNP